MSESQYGMVIDLRGCMGCQTCVISCKTSNEVPADGYWSHVLNLSGSDELYLPTEAPDVTMSFRPTLCNHCQNPACVMNCPTGAMHKDDKTGIVSVDQGICIGCKSCQSACPYSIPFFDAERTVVSKCNFCAGRIETDKDPYCVASCPARVRHFGLISESGSEVAKLINENDAQVYQPENGTNPSVYYILPSA